MIRPATETDAAAIAAIYNHYIEHTIVTFEEEIVNAAEMAGRIRDTLDAGLPWIVATENDHVVGYGYLSKWKSRCSYRYSVEASVYLDQAATRRGYGSQIYQSLINSAKALKMHAVIGGVSLPNPGSQRLHEKLGFEKIAHFREVGYKFDQWIDVGYWEKIL
ncbi:MAG: arsinothricin resistance N-acetyltransferase ArsN1 family B [Opitutaceae bacterium]